MGFCLFNNAAVGARYLQRHHGLERIAIVDWDVHHGNGTQHIFADDPSVLYVSTHQYPHYPGTGSASEVGRAGGEGLTLNIPLPAGCGDDEYRQVFERLVDPVCRQFDPDLVLISAGFDAHARDPLASMEMTESGYAHLTRGLLRIAADHAGGRCAAVLEGGYDLEALASSVLAVLDEMSAERLEEALPESDAPEELVAPILAVQREYWEL
jgi:acetoin utilization deacetylase AcuC-like enzyme